MQYEPLYLPPIRRADIVRSYRAEFNADNRCRRARHPTFENAMRLRARWLCGDSVKQLAARYCEGRQENAARILAGLGWMTPTDEELPSFERLVRDFYAALSECSFTHGQPEPGATFPLEQFARGEYKGPEVTGDDYDPAAADARRKDAETVPAGSPEAEPMDRTSPAWEAWRKTPFRWPEACPLCGGPVEFGPWSSDETDRMKGLECLNKACQLHGDNDGGITVERWNRKVAKLAKGAAADLLE